MPSALPPGPDSAPPQQIGLDANERTPDGRLRQRAIDHPEEFTHNTGEGALVQPDRAPDSELPTEAEALIIPTDSPGG